MAATAQGVGDGGSRRKVQSGCEGDAEAASAETRPGAVTGNARSAGARALLLLLLAVAALAIVWPLQVALWPSNVTEPNSVEAEMMTMEEFDAVDAVDDGKSGASDAGASDEDGDVSKDAPPVADSAAVAAATIPAPASCADFDVKLTVYPQGRLLVFRQGDWYPVCSHFFADNPHGAAAACRKMGYPGGQAHRMFGQKYTTNAIHMGSCDEGEEFARCKDPCCSSSECCTSMPKGCTLHAIGCSNCGPDQENVVEVECFGSAEKGHSSCQAEAMQEAQIAMQIAEADKKRQELVKTSGPTKYKIFTYWNYPGGPDPFVSLNVDTWRKHAPPGTEVVLVNNTNFHKLVPDTPEEWYRLPYAAANSDVVRAAVLYHQGGIYMDADFMVGGPLGDVMAKLDEGYDIVAYTDGDRPHATTGECRGDDGFSSNFFAARQGNPFSRTWWENIKAKLSRTCDVDEFQVEKVCCHEAFSPDAAKRACHIPWGHLEWLKQPSYDADAKPGSPWPDPTQRRRTKTWKHSIEGKDAEDVRAAVKRGNRKAEPLPAGARIWCMRGEDGMAPHLNGEVYWQPWDASAGGTAKDISSTYNYDMRFSCSEEDARELRCRKGNWGNELRTFKNFFPGRRIAYHLFFSTRKPSVRSRQDIMKGNWLISEMYRRSLAGAEG